MPVKNQSKFDSKEKIIIIKPKEEKSKNKPKT